MLPGHPSVGLCIQPVRGCTYAVNVGGAADLQIRLAGDVTVLSKADKMWPALIGSSDDGHGNINGFLQPKINCLVPPNRKLHVAYR